MASADRRDASRIDAARRAAVAVERYAPRSLSAPAAAVARELVAAAAPSSAARAKALLFAAGRLATFAEQAGLEVKGDEDKVETGGRRSESKRIGSADIGFQIFLKLLDAWAGRYPA